MLSAVVANHTAVDVKDAVVAFAAWDANGLPVKIIGQYEYSGGDYIAEVNCSGINLVDGESFGSDSEYALSEDCASIDFFKAVVSYEDFDGNTWKNPLYADWKTLYEGTKQK